MDGGEKRYNYKPFLMSQGNSGKMHVSGEQRKAGQETLKSTENETAQMQSYSKKVKHFCNILKTIRAFVQVETLQIAGRDVV